MDVGIVQIKTLLAVIGAIVAAVLAPVGSALTVLLALMAMDLISGIIANGKRRKLDPAVGWGGWKRKAQTIILVLAVAVLQQIVGGETAVTLPAAQAVAGGFAVVELLSIVRNALLSGVAFPVFLREAFAKIEEQILGESEPPA